MVAKTGFSLWIQVGFNLIIFIFKSVALRNEILEVCCIALKFGGFKDLDVSLFHVTCFLP